ncbi:MAG TPA: type II toxin-antitoxin system RelE/ParE family toxin [Thermoanaerobaculia bacterium]
MTDFRIFETEQFRRDLRGIVRSGEARIDKRLTAVVYAQLREHPHFGPNIRKLKQDGPETWRFRIGSWRFFYEIDEAARILFMIAASHRGYV